MSLRIRPSTRADLPVIAAFIRELAEYEKLGSEVRFSNADLDANLFGPHPHAEVLIGEIDGQARGFALFFGTFSTFEGKPGLWLEDLYVQPETRGHGLGKALLGELARIALDRGCARLEWSVLDWNAPSIGFYKSLGATPMDEWTTMRVTGAALKDLGASP